MRKKIIAVGRWRLDFERFSRYRLAFRSGGQATAWPWREVAIPGVGSLVLGRTRPRPIPHEVRPDRLHMSRPDPTQDAGPCDCSIGADHDGPARFPEGEPS